MMDLKVTHEGKLKLNAVMLDVGILTNEVRYLTVRSLYKIFDVSFKGRETETGLPKFLSTKYLEPYINKELKHYAKQIECTSSTGRKFKAYDSDMLVYVCEVFIDAYDAGVLKSDLRLEWYVIAKTLIRVLAKTGLKVLIDEAVGLDVKDVQKTAKQKYIDDKFALWSKTFPDVFYKHIYRLKGWDYNPLSHKRPKVIGKITNTIVYDTLDVEVLAELKNKAKPYINFHQWFSRDVGHPKLREHLSMIIAVMKLSKNWEDFEKNLKTSLED